MVCVNNARGIWLSGIALGDAGHRSGIIDEVDHITVLNRIEFHKGGIYNGTDIDRPRQTLSIKLSLSCVSVSVPCLSGACEGIMWLVTGLYVRNTKQKSP